MQLQDEPKPDIICKLRAGKRFKMAHIANETCENVKFTENFVACH
ncbi:hypothetical protein GPLA_2977 [Paraglaciecola polaris LMG 21857]|uniref:Uncharacterized protein n=1 Tax=Paraglaciecola polaris LMG 21857 TaxID=1129793 RepID=K7AF01_9ALTE|nr:hypothetical protein GPLA_2977 [Paraglaciecola polaris LMG 21857]